MVNGHMNNILGRINSWQPKDVCIESIATICKSDLENQEW